MTIRDLVRAYVLEDMAVETLGGRLYPDQLPEKVTYPAGVILAVDIVRPNTLRGVASLAKARIQIDIYANPGDRRSSRYRADVLGATIRQRLDGFDGSFTDSESSPGTPVRAWVTFDLETENAERDLSGGLSRHTADYFVQYQTQGGTY